MNDDLALLHEKIDYLTQQVEAQRQRQAVFSELGQDLVPVFNQLFQLTVKELDEIGGDFQLEDLLYLVKRLLRDTPLLIDLLDRLEATVALVDEVGLLTKPMFNSAVESLDRMEREGYFNFAQNGWYVMEQIVSEFDEEDVRALGDNVVTILHTVRNMTQPDIMGLANNVIDNMRDEEPSDEKVSTWRLLREMSDPQVRKGLSRLLGMVKALADQPNPNNGN